MRFLLLLLIGTALPLFAERPPNILFFLVDDLGWADLGCYGAPYHETPNLDRLAAEGIRFTDAYTAASICSPTRASIMTGRHPVRVGITDWIPGMKAAGRKLRTPEDRDHLALEEVTIAEVLREAGYATFYTGKWHLGGKGFGPEEQGFETYYDPHRDSSKGSPGRGKTNGRKHATRDLTRETMKFINAHREQPWFAYVSYYDVHTPIIAEEEFLPHFEEKAAALGPPPAPIREREGLSRPRQDNPAYASMVRTVDRSVGTILTRLNEFDLDSNTVVFFFSDNGGLCTKAKVGPACNLPLRASKGWLYEGGIRVPLLVRMPSGGPKNLVTNYPVISTDFFPTILSLAGLETRPALHPDGGDFSLLLRGAKIKRTARDLFWHYPHYHGSTWTPGAAIRSGPWKLIEFYHFGGHELYDLRNDPGERHDLSETEPAKARELLEKLHAWQKDLGAAMPVPAE